MTVKQCVDAHNYLATYTAHEAPENTAVNPIHVGFNLKLGLGIGIPVIAVVIGLIIFFIVRRH